MRLLFRYLIRECLVALAFCFSAFLILWIAFDLLSGLHDLQEDKLRAIDIVQYYIFRIPEFLPVVLPVALLLALLYALTTHARHNEITAMRAAGVSLWRVCLPYFTVGFMAAVMLFVCNEFFAPKTAEIAERIRTRRVERNRTAEERRQIKNFLFKNEREDRIWWAGIYNWQTGEMIKPTVEWPLPDGSRRKLFAERAVHTNGVWTFYEVRELRQTVGTNAMVVRLPQTNVLAMPTFSESLEEIRSEILVNDRRNRQSRTYNADVPIGQILQYRRLHPVLTEKTSAWLDTKLHGRVAGPCTCLVVVLLAVPFAVGSGRRNVFVGVAASLVIFFAFYITQQLGSAFGEKGQIPAWLGAWFPNLLFGVSGLWMMARVR